MTRRRAERINLGTINELCTPRCAHHSGFFLYLLNKMHWRILPKKLKPQIVFIQVFNRLNRATGLYQTTLFHLYICQMISLKAVEYRRVLCACYVIQ